MKNWTNIQFCETICLREKYVRKNRRLGPKGPGLLLLEDA